MAVLWLLYLQNWLWQHYLRVLAGPLLQEIATQRNLSVRRGDFGPVIRAENARLRVSLRGGLRGARIEVRVRSEHGARQVTAPFDEVGNDLMAWVTQVVEGSEE